MRMGKVMKVGCLGVIVLVVLVGIIAALGGSRSEQPAQAGLAGSSQPAAQEGLAGSSQPATRATPTAPALATVGETVEHGGWAITLEKVETAAELRNIFRNEQAQGIFVILTFAVTNKGKKTTVLNEWDFNLKAPDGVTFRPSRDGQMVLVAGDPRPLILAEQIQPGLSQRFRMVFDVNPAIKSYTWEAAGTRFAITLP
jgi:hypothetical protein